jgi:hypothetical protein
MSAFAEWFEAQHGPRQKNGPTGSVAGYSDDELEMAASRGAAAADELRRRKLWDEKRTSALYAWQAAPKS